MGKSQNLPYQEPMKANVPSSIKGITSIKRVHRKERHRSSTRVQFAARHKSHFIYQAYR